LLLQGIQNDHTYSNQSDIIYHDDTITAFIGSHQWPKNPGNTIVIPNRHYENIFDLPIRYAQEIQRAAKRLALAMKTVYACDGISTRQHNEPAGNQDVWHYHIHITPRYQNDDFYSTISQRTSMPPEERAQHAAKLRNALNGIYLYE
jgi:histidine triad (HIT) family protein